MDRCGGVEEHTVVTVEHEISLLSSRPAGISTLGSVSADVSGEGVREGRVDGTPVYQARMTLGQRTSVSLDAQRDELPILRRRVTPAAMYATSSEVTCNEDKVAH